jgi:hypothetical protein
MFAQRNSGALEGSSGDLLPRPCKRTTDTGPGGTNNRLVPSEPYFPHTNEGSSTLCDGAASSRVPSGNVSLSVPWNTHWVATKPPPVSPVLIISTHSDVLTPEEIVRLLMSADEEIRPLYAIPQI